MLPFKDKAHEAGMTLIETMVASTIAVLFTYGGYQMLSRTQKYLSAKEKSQLGKTEGIDLAAVIKKDWDYRMLANPPTVPATPNVPTAGFKLLSATNAPCTADCPRIKLWVKRSPVGSPAFIDEILVENICVTPNPTAVKDQTMTELLKVVDFTSNKIVNTACGICPRTQVPAVRFTGVDMVTRKVTLQAENRLLPNNIGANQRAQDPIPMKQNSVLGMQACFSQSAAQMPLNVDIRSIVLTEARDDKGKPNQIISIQNTQVFPYDNFANIRLE